MVSNCCTCLGFNASYVYLPDRAEEKGMNQLDSAFLLSVIGVFVSLNAVILVDLLGLERLNKALGLLMMFQGIATFKGPPLCENREYIGSL
ncbi:uncharacterized protein LOC127715925 [Mytilus californianus]|uniref:uncharacterized protein LOC127715925 n=1 Tax=Mytilus californianus TaxID=6549 RepID=UPI00224605A0|nr:uncharacterized protein LOC127715925 [Mytilus californianus]